MRNKKYFGGVSPYRQTDDKGSSNTEPIGSKELVVMPIDSILSRQQFKESGFDSSAVSSAGATSIAQITKATFKDGLKKGYVPAGTKYEDLAKDDKLATQFQRAQMNDLLNRSWNKGNESVRMAKALAAYNMGASRLVGILNNMREDGYDIYESLDWVEDLPKYHRYLSGEKKGQPIVESKDYVKKILIGDNEKKYIEISSDKSKIDTLSFEDRYERAYNAKYGGVSPFQQEDEDLDSMSRRERRRAKREQKRQKENQKQPSTQTPTTVDPTSGTTQEPELTTREAVTAASEVEPKEFDMLQAEGIQSADDWEQKKGNVLGLLKTGVERYYTDLYEGPETAERAKEIYGEDYEQVLENKKNAMQQVRIRVNEMSQDDLDIFTSILQDYGGSLEDFRNLSREGSHEAAIGYLDQILTGLKADKDNLNEREYKTKVRALKNALSSESSYTNRYGTEEIILDAQQAATMLFNMSSILANEYAHATGAIDETVRGGAKRDLRDAVSRGETLTKEEFIQAYPSPSGLTGNLTNVEAARIYDNLKPGVLGREDIAQDVDHQVAHEIASDIQTLRYDLYVAGIYDPSSEKFNASHLEKARKLYKGDKTKSYQITKLNQLESIMDDEGLIDTMNFIVKDDTGSGDLIGGVGDPRQV
tara:strand:+ start:96 stop:2039 length:1944 start_codon:yes stop_codon:yes gene_type:complete